MKIIGEKVSHKKYGEGTITSLSGNVISVKFASLPDARKFSYPECFNSFLTLHNQSLLSDINTKADEVKAATTPKSSFIQINSTVTKPTSTKASSSSSYGSKQSSSKTVVRRFDKLDEFVDHYSRNLVSEIAFIKRTGGKHQVVYDGIFLEQMGQRYVYQFESDTELNYQSGSKITIYYNELEYEGAIEDISEFSIIISTELDLGHTKDTEIVSLEFSVEQWRLMSDLNNRFEVLKMNPSCIVKAITTEGTKQIDFRTKMLTGQDTALKMAGSQPITFIWGPPGTGKTETLAKIVLDHISNNKRVLMVSYSNVSVDGAIKRVNNVNKKKETGKFVRYGYPKDKDLKENSLLTSYNYVINKNPELVKKRDELLKTINRLKKERALSEDLKKCKEDLKKIRTKLGESEKELVKNAMFVATTAAKAVSDAAIYSQKFDTVIFDEASMAYIPQIIVAASLAKQHFICLGDFCQLPPIVQGDNSDSLNADIFQYCGITDAVERKCNHKWLCMLDVQYRMHPEIADIASNAMYNGYLKTAPNIKDKRDIINGAIPELQKAFGMLDLSYMMSTCVPMKDKSRINVLSAFISFAIAHRAKKILDKYQEENSSYENNGVGIISPYSTQARLLHCMAMDQSERSLTEPIPCATVHQFQGSEKDVIVFDAVDCYRQTHPGLLISGMKNNYANKLFNVALTRARGKFALVTNSKYMIDKNLGSKLMFTQLMSKAKSMSAMYGNELSSIKMQGDSCIQFYSEADKDKEIFLNDISSAKKSIYIDIPDAPANDSAFMSKLYALLNMKKQKSLTVVVRAEKRSSVPAELRPMTIEHSFSMNPVVVIDKTITWYGLPLSRAKFKADGFEIPTKFYPIIRFEGRKTARTIYGLLEMNKTTDEAVELDENEVVSTFAQYILRFKKCNSCNKNMKLTRARTGNFFIACTGYPACTQTERLTSDFVDKYLYDEKGKSRVKCPKCQMSLEARSGPYGVYIKCCGLNEHKYKVNEI